MTLGGSTFIHNGIEFDYNFIETIDCLSELCDKVVVVDAGSDDATQPKLYHYMTHNRWPNVFVKWINPTEWRAQHGREKLSYFSNIAIQELGTDFNFYLQADEVIHEDSFPFIRKAIEEPNANAFVVRRYNLWKDPYHILNVEHARKPCSTDVIRLAKSQYQCVGDAESLGVSGNCSIDYLSKIEIFHMGFVRKREVMKAKIINMQENVFEMGTHEPKLDLKEVFDPMDYFSESDLVPLHKPLPEFIQKWAQERANYNPY